MTLDPLLSDKLSLFESHLQHAWVQWDQLDEVVITSKTSGMPVKKGSYQLSDLVHKLDIDRVSEYYQNLDEEISKIRFTIYRKGEDNLKVVCASRKVQETILSVWILLIDEGKTLGLMALAAHDMRSPVSNIKGMVDLIQMMMMDESIPAEELNKMLGMIKTSTDKALRLTDEILELSELESDGFVLTARAHKMKDFLHEYVGELAPVSTTKKIEVVVDMESDAVCRIDTHKIHRVLDNLISNAAKFSYTDSQIEIIGREVEDNRLLVMIKDHGIGMPQELIDEIFIRFGKAQRQGLEGEDSHGLGMAIVKQIMTLHGGEITVESEERKGTTMNLFFPIEEPK